ncbi:MAG: hypothetical protein WBB34_12165 [Xanthobacteraceae bacterium]
MAVDVVLWFILAAAIAFIGCGCMLTAPKRKAAKTSEAGFEPKLDRAA